MKRILAVVLFVTFIAAPGAAQSKGKRAGASRARTPGASVEQSLLEAERQMGEAFKNRDRAALDRQIADNAIFTDDGASVFGKAKFIESATRIIRIESYKLDDLEARAGAAAGVVTGRWTGTVTINGKTSSGAFRFTDVFVRRAGRWVLIASQDTGIPQKDNAMSNAITTPSGLKYIDEVVGTGASPSPGQMVTVHYTGTFENGTKFDSSVDHGQPLTFPIGVGRVIKGWDEGVMSMKVGGKRRLIVPPQLGYGAGGYGGVIPPNATLIFDVELIGVK